MNNALGKTIAEVFESRYVIPLYQRNFAWRTEEVQQLLQDVYEAFLKSPEGNYYVGSLVVLKRHNGDYEVIDGQQRLTVISMIAIFMNKLSQSVLRYDSRPIVQTFLDRLCKDSQNALDMDDADLYYLKDAYTQIQNAKVTNPGHGGTQQFIKIDGISEFFMNHVVLVRNEIPEDTDVAAYFEIMNNRGEQLQKHELIKAGMMELLKNKDSHTYDIEKQKQFAAIWDACAQMDMPIQRCFPVARRKQYFGEGFDGFSFEETATGTMAEKRELSISEILGLNEDAIVSVEKDANVDEEECDASEYHSILDFPNFLMHIFRLYLKVYDQDERSWEEVSLNEKELWSVYQKFENKIDPMKFAGLLLFGRTAFDRFVVKTENDNSDGEDGSKWILVKPKKYDKGWKYISSFEGGSGEKVIKAVSMLQVTFRTRVYKNWLFETMLWLYQQSCNGDLTNVDLAKISARDYLTFLHDHILRYYKEQGYDIQRVGENECPTQKNSFSRGTDTPHFLLNFIDYLYFCKLGSDIRHFDFKYWNSVEHHLAQNKGGQLPFIDNLGNLCLVSKGTNSRLSDRDVKEKVEAYEDGNLGPNRQLIYQATRAAQWQWGENEIRKHYNDIVSLLSERNQLLTAVLPSADPVGIQLQIMRDVEKILNGKCVLEKGGHIDTSLTNEETGFVFAVSGVSAKIRVSAEEIGGAKIFVGVIRSEAETYREKFYAWYSSGCEHNHKWVWKYCTEAEKWDDAFYSKCQTDVDFVRRVVGEIANLILEIVQITIP